MVGNNPQRRRRIFEVEFIGDRNFAGKCKQKANIWEICITTDILLINLFVFLGALDNFENGIRRDLQDLEQLVRLAIAEMPENIWPDSLKLYLHPLFWSYVFDGNIRYLKLNDTALLSELIIYNFIFLVELENIFSKYKGYESS